MTFRKQFFGQACVNINQIYAFYESLRIMISLDTIGKYFTPQIRDNPALHKYMIKEYLLLLILDFLLMRFEAIKTGYIKKMSYIFVEIKT